MRHLNIRVYGRVQGVFFRFSASRRAKALHIRGFVRNEQDGTVYIEAEGTDENLKKFISWCNAGPPLSRVTKLEVAEGACRNFTAFLSQ